VNAGGDPAERVVELGVRRLDRLPDAAVGEGLRACCGSTRFVAEVSAARPFGSVARLRAAVERAVGLLGRNDWLEAFHHHPRIGDVEALRVRFANTTSQVWSRGEQAGVAGADETALERLAVGNREYEARFGYLFIVCASGKSIEEMTNLLEARLANDPATELEIAAGEQRAITTLRLERWLRQLGDTKPTSSSEEP
jgi:2-oxo-4-hydroxy-4-carboxy-5-ureidoimidazoline decarboxylase